MRTTRGIAALLAYGPAVPANAEGDFAAAANHYRDAARIEHGLNLSKTRAVEADARATAAAPGNFGDAATGLSGIASLAGDAVNRPNVPTADAANSAFTAAAQKTATILITVWRAMSAAPFASGRYYMQNLNFGASCSLDITPDTLGLFAPRMLPTGNVTGQFWTFTRRGRLQAARFVMVERYRSRASSKVTKPLTRDRVVCEPSLRSGPS